MSFAHGPLRPEFTFPNGLYNAYNADRPEPHHISDSGTAGWQTCNILMMTVDKYEPRNCSQSTLMENVFVDLICLFVFIRRHVKSTFISGYCWFVGGFLLRDRQDMPVKCYLVEHKQLDGAIQNSKQL